MLYCGAAQRGLSGALWFLFGCCGGFWMLRALADQRRKTFTNVPRMDDVVGGVHGKKHLLSLLKKELRSASIPSDDAIQALHASFRRLLLQDEQHFDFAADEVSSKFTSSIANTSKKKPRRRRR